MTVGAVGGVAALTAARKFPLARADRAKRSSMAPPRYYIKLWLAGGIDSILTLDPKERREVAPGVDLPYAAKEIVDAGGFRLGPHFAPLAGWASRMTILKGVDTSTANHNTGQSQAIRLRTKTTEAMPSIFEILGAHRDGQPLGSISLGASKSEAHSPGWFGEPGPLYGPADHRLFRHVDAAAPDDLRLLAKVLKRQAQGLGGRGHEALTTAENIGECAAFFERVADVPKFAPVTWDGLPQTPDVPDMAARLQRALWLIENDLTSTMFINVVGTAIGWDTHIDSNRLQAKLSGKFVPMFDRFLKELSTRSNRHGKLIDNTLLMVASELGRFPYTNNALGKDHFPEAPFLFMGQWFPTGKAYGQTGKQLEAAPIDPAAGRAGAGHHLYLDDVGATVLTLAGIDPELYGYNGRALGFLLQG